MVATAMLLGGAFGIVSEQVAKMLTKQRVAIPATQAVTK
jgi:hypothetical protein